LKKFEMDVDVEEWKKTESEEAGFAKIYRLGPC
jgi:hypothetical protein